MNIPIYRAKKIDSDEYIEGFFLFQEESRECIEICQIYNSKIRATYEVDISTLAIHFPDMLDNQGNKIFASLSEDGKGGDICESKWFKIDKNLTVKTGSVRYSNMGMIQDGYNISRYEYKKVVGIQE